MASGHCTDAIFVLTVAPLAYRMLYNLRDTIYDPEIMTADEFRQIALSFPGTGESLHMDHPDFRVCGKIFATLGPDLNWGMAKLTPDQQQVFLRNEPQTFKPANGKWGEQGATIITLASADDDTVRQALRSAWRNTAPKELLESI